jgi:hypothetical protein
MTDGAERRIGVLELLRIVEALKGDARTVISDIVARRGKARRTRGRTARTRMCPKRDLEAASGHWPGAHVPKSGTSEQRFQRIIGSRRCVN